MADEIWPDVQVGVRPDGSRIMVSDLQARISKEKASKNEYIDSSLEHLDRAEAAEAEITRLRADLDRALNVVDAAHNNTHAINEPIAQALFDWDSEKRPVEGFDHLGRADGL
jgi:hypothetical protein